MLLYVKARLEQHMDVINYFDYVHMLTFVECVNVSQCFQLSQIMAAFTLQHAEQ